ncbi:Glutamine--tRNA ligase [Geodia barretti]|uniref:glutamine--tRNA ligase n=5 Tax=Geodia barretti TaxID=519541 RepID=A0AA35W7Z1_GEOBA|nr:Glutamine--tRNA ligase [Geodia barretti]
MSRFKGSQERSGLLVVYVCDERIRTEQQLTAALEYLKSHPVGEVDEEEFSRYSGVGVLVTPQQIHDQVSDLLEHHKSELMKLKYKFPVGKLMGEMRQRLRWADGKLVKEVIDQQLEALIGPRSQQSPQSNIQKSGCGGKSGAKAVVKEKKAGEEEESRSEKTAGELFGEAANFHKPGENYKTEGYVVTPHTMRLLKKHLEETGGKVVTRFPPEPNGILHIGHAKAINFNFGYAKAHGGITYLRYDDTNPEKEEERFIRGIQEMVKWLGHKPYKINFSSDYFGQLYEWAVELIKRGHAYVCHQTQDELKGHNPPPSPWRERPVEESLLLFEDMKRGKFEEGEATLRMKHVMEDSKQDPVAYRIKYTPHPHAGDAWCVYPTYDFTHCLCDSIENISHSLCTKEFQARRSSYYWLCNALDLYCPVQWEYGRLNLQYTVVSKRKIQKLIGGGIVADWDDPRLYTLTALRRRGIPPEAIHKFTAKVGVTMSQAILHPNLLDSCVRDELNNTATRVMAVLDPVKVVVENLADVQALEVEVLNIPHLPGKGAHKVFFDPSNLYIDASDFKEVAESGYRRLAPGQPVGLKHAGYVISHLRTEKDSSGSVAAVVVEAHRTEEVDKPKAFIQWVSRPVPSAVRLYYSLFLHPNPEDPAKVPNGFLSDISPNSMEVKSSAMVDETVLEAGPLTGFQFERIGYFCVDFDSTPQQMVFNRTVSLREDSGKS